MNFLSDLLISLVLTALFILGFLLGHTAAKQERALQIQKCYGNLLTAIYTAQYTQFETLMWKFFALYQRNYPDSDFSIPAIENFETFKNLVGRMSTPELKGLNRKIDTTSKSGIADWIHSRRYTITEMRQFIVGLINSINLIGEDDISINLLNTIDGYLKAMLDNNNLTIDMLVGKDISVYLLTDEFKAAMEKIPS